MRSPVRVRHRGRGERPGARSGRPPLRPCQHDGPRAPPGRWPRRRGRRGSTRSWSAVTPRQRREPRSCRGPAEQLPSRRVAALEHGLEPGHRCFALQAQAPGASAVPAARGLAVTGQILLVVGGQLPGVVLLPPHRQLGDVGDHPAAPPAFVGASECTRGALHSSDDSGSSVVRNGAGHPLWRWDIRQAAGGAGWRVLVACGRGEPVAATCGSG
jgi:hypothetical protein